MQDDKLIQRATTPDEIKQAREIIYHEHISFGETPNRAVYLANVWSRDRLVEIEQALTLHSAADALGIPH